MRPKTARKSESRRMEAKRRRSEQRGSLWQNISRRVSPWALMIGVGFYLATTAILLWGSESMPWRLGQRLDRDITARVPFEFEDRVATQQFRQTARASAPNVYIANPAPLTLIRGGLQELRELAASAGGDTGKLKAQAAAKGWPVDDAAARVLQDYAREEKRSAYEDLVTRVVERLGAQYIVEKASDPNREVSPPTSIMRGEGQAPEVREAELLYITDSKSVDEAIRQVVRETEGCPAALFGPFARLISLVLLGPPDADGPRHNPLWLYSPEATAEEMEAAVQRVEPRMVSRKAGATLVKAKTVLRDSELTLLKREHEHYVLAQKIDPELRRKKLLSQLGMAVVVLLVSVGLASYTAYYQGRILEKPARALGLAGLMLLMIGLSRLVERAPHPWDLAPEFSVGFIVIASALLTIAYDQRFAFGAGGVLAILATLSSGGDLGLFLTFLAAMGITVFALKDVRTRGKIIAVGAMAALGALVTSVASGLIAGQELRYVLEHAAAAVGAAFFAGFIVQGILHYFERLFGIATSMTLLECGDANRPLLRRLAQQAPGTYSHSVSLSQIAEGACEAIGARGLLARVGALYHDIGKTQKAEYFVENQASPMNRHERLSPTMSLLIILGHVKDGVEMARAYGLPRILHQFITEHHGTTIVKYFHHAASEAAAKNNKTKGRHDRKVPESEFRYPGPKPRSRESAILMLCDGCEGAVRALSEPTPGRIESTVHQVVMDRLHDGQFDDCDITLRELKLVERSVVKSLGAIHHGRIKYPKGPGEQEQASVPRAGEKPEHGEEAAPIPSPSQTPEVMHQA